MNKIRGFEKVSVMRWMTDVNNETSYYNENDFDNIRMPKRATSHSAGYDIFSPIDFNLEPGSTIKIATGLKAYMQPDEFLMIFPRSGLGFKYYTRLANTVGIGDSDYYNNSGNEGHYFVKIRNEGEIPLTIKSGDAIAQAIFQKYLLTDEDNFEGKERIGGIGSTSKP